jgi:hypothetical protein
MGADKIKEADAIRIGPLPSPGAFRPWRLALFTEVQAASGRADAAFLWLRKAELPDVSFASLSTSGNFESLDAKLLAALVRSASGTIVGGQISRAQETAAKGNRPLKGRQALLLVFQHYRVERSHTSLQGFADLLSLELHGSNDLQTFMDNWDGVLCGVDD